MQGRDDNSAGDSDFVELVLLQCRNFAVRWNASPGYRDENDICDKKWESGCYLCCSVNFYCCAVFQSFVLKYAFIRNVRDPLFVLTGNIFLGETIFYAFSKVMQFKGIVLPEEVFYLGQHCYERLRAVCPHMFE